MYDTTTELLHEVEKRREVGGVDIIGAPTGFEELDFVLGGWRDDEMYSVGGATGSGKSSFCLSTALSVARQGGHVVYFSFEMSAKLLALRTLAAMTGLPAMKIEKGKLSDVSMKQVRAAAETFNGLPIFFYDKSATTTHVGDVLRLQREKRGLDLAVVDYIALLTDGGNTPYERVTNISINLRGHARDFDIPLIVVSQLNRSSLNRESGRPQLQDLKESGQIENDSGGVIFPFRPRSDEENENPDVERAELIVAKNRHGPVGTFPVEFLPKQMVWRPIGGTPVDPPPHVRRHNGTL